MTIMKKPLLLLAAAILLTACGPNSHPGYEERISQIETVEDSLFAHNDEFDTVAADRLTELYLAFADEYPNDSLTPQYLMNAAEMQSNVLHTDRAVQIFDRIINDYADFPDVPLCYLLIGHAYDLNCQYEEARDAYQLFVDKFPDHFMADDIRLMIPTMGMTPEELFDYNLSRLSGNKDSVAPIAI